jgi:hypothetical protein
LFPFFKLRLPGLPSSHSATFCRIPALQGKASMPLVAAYQHGNDFCVPRLNELRRGDADRRCKATKRHESATGVASYNED